MAATRGPLQSLALAAAALPGLVPRAAVAEDHSIDIEYGHYQEGSRDLGGPVSKHAPIQADSLHQRLQLRLGDRWHATVNYFQDAWSGATAVASAPLVGEPNRGTSPDGITGASPYLYTGIQLDEQFRPLRRDMFGALVGADTRVAPVVTGASREIRRQVDASVTREFERYSLDFGAGTSREPDYRADFGSLAAHWRLAQDRLTLNASASHTSSMTDAQLDHDSQPYVYGYYDFKGNNAYNQRHVSSQYMPGNGAGYIHGGRSDWSAQLGIAAVLTKRSLLEASLGALRGRGYLGNPYKAVEVAFVDPTQQFGTAGGNADADYAYDAQLNAIPEERPDRRDAQTLGLRYVQAVGARDAALHLGYRYYQDNWGVRSHTLDVQWVQPMGRGWTLTPGLRYYSQSAADFYTPWLVSRQGLLEYVKDPVLGQIFINSGDPNNGQSYYEDFSIAPPIDNDPNSWNYGNPIYSLGGGAYVDRNTGLVVDSQALADQLSYDTALFDQAGLPRHYSSDTRLAGFGSVSASLAVARQFDNGLSLALGWEHYRRRASLGMGTANTGFADYDSDYFSLALQGELRARTGSGAHAAHAGHGAGEAPTLPAPAGILGAHGHGGTGAWMVDYRVERAWQSGVMRRDGRAVGDAELVAVGCGNGSCYVTPTDMSMTMQMLHLGYRVNERVTLMLMPQWVDNHMTMRPLAGAPPGDGMGPIGSALMHADHPHTTSTPGDTELTVLVKLDNSAVHALTAALGLGLPTGAAGLRMRDVMQQKLGYYDYDMQTGSGTYDLKAGLALASGVGRLRGGAQLEGTVRLQRRNAHGYARGDVLRATAWGATRLGGPVAATARLQYTREGAMRGAYAGTVIAIGPGDLPGNQGGSRFDAGAGLSLALPAPGSAHDRLTLEWLQPLGQQLRGYQLHRQGTLAASLSLSF